MDYRFGGPFAFPDYILFCNPFMRHRIVNIYVNSNANASRFSLFSMALVKTICEFATR
jgi:hypothetical protein